MDFFRKIGINRSDALVDWELTPADTFGMFESWGGKERIRNKDERFYYFYVDNWTQPARVCLMERGIKYARVLARILIPQELVDQCVRAQGRSGYDQSYAIDNTLRQWLLKNVVEPGSLQWVELVAEDEDESKPPQTGLPVLEDLDRTMGRVVLRRDPVKLMETDISSLVRSGNFFDSHHNPGGVSATQLVDNGDGLTVSEMATGLMWQRDGSDITSIRTGRNLVADLNRAFFAGYSDWRLPTIDEALSLLTPQKNRHGLHVHPCFSPAQPFIFTADERNPGGNWFVDLNNATVYWASGFNPGGYVRVCRSIC